MVKHVVMYKLNESSEKAKEELVNVFLSMKGKIPYLKSITSGADFLNSDRSFDVVLICEFENAEDMEKYKKHEVHLPVVDYVKKTVQKSHSVDFIF